MGELVSRTIKEYHRGLFLENFVFEEEHFSLV
jgi:hypothetical protein